MIHDFVGGLGEELLRTNFILVYELIDELIVNLTCSELIGLWTPLNNKYWLIEVFCEDGGREMLPWNNVFKLFKVTNAGITSGLSLN